MSVFFTTPLETGRRCELTAPSRAVRRAIPFEYLLFVLALSGLGAGCTAIALGLLRPPTASMVVGDWYLLTSGFVIVVAAGSNRRAILLMTLAVTACAVAAYLPLRAIAPTLEPKTYVKTVVALVAAIAINWQFAIGVRRGGALRDNRDLAVACFAVALVVTPMLSGWGIQISAVIPQTLDAHALKMDEAFGLRVPAALGALTRANAVSSYIVFHVYISISLAMVGYDLVFDDMHNWRMTKLMLVSSFLGFFAYFITPTVGTIFFPAYGSAPLLGDILASADGSKLPRNAMPSLHTTWGVMLIVAAVLQPRAGVWRRMLAPLFALYGALSVCGALVFGDHYLIDCIVALPFAATILLSFDNASGRGRRAVVCFWTGVALFVAWIALLRIGGSLIAPPVVLAMTVASIAHLLASATVLRRAPPSAPGWT